MWQEMKRHKVRMVKIVILWFVIFVYGLGQGMYGPTLIDLSDQVNTAFSYVAFILPCRSFGVIIGSTLGKLISFANNCIVDHFVVLQVAFYIHTLTTV